MFDSIEEVTLAFRLLCEARGRKPEQPTLMAVPLGAILAVLHDVPDCWRTAVEGLLHGWSGLVGVALGMPERPRHPEEKPVSSEVELPA